MKVLMLHSEDSGVGYYRIWQQAKYLERMGWDVRRLPDRPVVIPFDTAVGKNSEDPAIRRNYEKFGSYEELANGIDLLVVQRSDQPDILAMAMAIREIANCPVVYELDDNIYDVSQNSPSYPYWQPGSPLRELADMFMQNANALTTTTEALRDVYSPNNDNIYVLPNCQDPEDWEGLKRNPEDKIVIGWAGSATHYDDLEVIKPAIKKILKRYPNVVFRVIGTIPDFLQDIKGVELRKDFAPIRNWPKKLAELSFDIGLAPVVNRPFNQGKSNIKWQEYAMLEIPTIASDVGPYKCIQNGVDGLLSNNSPANWYKAIESLVLDAELRKKLGSNAKQRVLKDFNIEKNIGQWDQAYRKVVEQYQDTNAQ